MSPALENIFKMSMKSISKQSESKSQLLYSKVQGARPCIDIAMACCFPQ